MLRAIALIGLGAALSGCGLVPMLAERTVSAAMAPVTRTAQATAVAARATGSALQIAERTVVRTASTLGQAAVQSSRALQQTAAATLPYRMRPITRPVAYAAPRASMPRSTSHKPNKTRVTREPETPDITVLPAETLARLTPQQAGLQKAAQAEALTAPVGEAIYWEIDGRSGTAMAESESPLGSFVCRTFLQTVTIDGAVEEGSVVACHNDAGVWTTSF